MPELPDILYIEKKLKPLLSGRKILSVRIHNPIVIRNALGGGAEQLEGLTFEEVGHRGHFLNFRLEQGYEIIMNLMLAGQLQYTEKGKVKKLCLAFHLDNGMNLNYGDVRLMGKIYFIRDRDYGLIPGYTDQGLDILGPGFTLEAFQKRIAGKRVQVRVFLMDRKMILAVGNAYADEILFKSGLHPKTPCNKLTPEEREKLYNAILEVMNTSIRYVEEKDRPIEIKVRNHMKVRNRKGEPCPECGTPIRRAQVHGYDTFFCPRCQPPSGEPFLDWNRSS